MRRRHREVPPRALGRAAQQRPRRLAGRKAGLRPGLVAPGGPARGTRLAPADQQLFTRDSTARAQAEAQRRAHLATALGQIAADSSALAAAFAPAIDALSEYVRSYPGSLRRRPRSRRCTRRVVA